MTLPAPVDVALALAADADAGDAELLRGVVGGPDGGQGVGREEVPEGGGAAAEEQTTVDEWVGHGESDSGVRSAMDR